MGRTAAKEGAEWARLSFMARVLYRWYGAEPASQSELMKLYGSCELAEAAVWHEGEGHIRATRRGRYVPTLKGIRRFFPLVALRFFPFALLAPLAHFLRLYLADPVGGTLYSAITLLGMMAPLAFYSSLFLSQDASPSALGGLGVKDIVGPGQGAFRARRRGRGEAGGPKAADVQRTLKRELDGLRHLLPLGSGLKLRWSPRGGELAGEVKGGVIWIYEAEPEKALKALRHEYLDYVVSQALKPHSQLNKALVKLYNEYAYRVKEEVVEELSRLLEVARGLRRRRGRRPTGP